MNRKLISVVLSLALVFGSMGMAFADEAVLISAGPAFADMPDNWSTAALNNAVTNKLLQGYDENGTMFIKADKSLSRAEMAAVVNRAFASTSVADISKVTDVESWAWYVTDMAKAVKMGTFALDTKMRPGDNITRQEAFAVLSRAFKLASADDKYKALDKFSDKGDIAAWALKDLDGMAAAGYIQGSDGKLNPTANITRAEFAVVMDNLVKQYIDEAGTVTEVVATGNVMVRVPGVTLKDITVKGDLIIADGVGEGNVTLDNVKVEGRTVIRGGGENSIIIKGNSDLGRVIVSKVDGKVRVTVEGGAEVEIIYVDDGSDDVLVEGTVGTLEVAGSDVTVTATNATITKAEVSGDNAKIVVGTGSTVKEGSVSGKSSGITVNAGAKVDAVTVSGSDAKIDGSGEVPKVTVAAGGSNASVTTPNTVTTVSSGASGVTAGGVAVPAGGTATNNSSGTGATVTQPPATGGGGGGVGGGSPDNLYINVDDVNYSISSLNDVYLTRGEVIEIATGLGTAILGSSAYDGISVTITGNGEGVFGTLASGTYDAAALKAKLTAIATAVAPVQVDRDTIIANADASATGITGISYKVDNGDLTTIKKIELSGVADGPYVLWGVDYDNTTNKFGNLYDALKGGKTLVSLNGLTMTVTLSDDSVKVIKLEYK